MYDPIKLTHSIEQIVLDGTKKKYYRFRPTRFYGGISTADTVGCNLRCSFCWSAKSVWNAKNTGDFYKAEEVADKLQKIADKKGYNQLRISGGEPTIGKKHLLKLLGYIKKEYLFILETNGILLGYNENYVKRLSFFKNLHVRVCIKGCNKKEFSFLTGSKTTGFEYQIKSLDFLKKHKINFNIALVTTKSEKEKKIFYDRLQDIGLNHVMVEDEKIKLYPNVRKRLKERGLLKYFL